ncbi:MAG TPA: DUF4867 family protein [Candidatus Gallacutalibacter stercoravium]|nr:DUF4867 family protein [Candidatus Gallacutalibacter stercoravium]
MQIKRVTDQSFSPYGRVIKGVDCTQLIEAMEQTPLPDDVIYVPSDPALEALPVFQTLQNQLYGELPIQLGYCNGNNHKLNALEYHRTSEINVACTDLILLLGRQQDIAQDYTYGTYKVEAFLVPKGTVIEVYATTLHYAPCNAGGKFRCVVVLPKGTNLPLAGQIGDCGEDRLLFASNKWLIAHPESGLDKDGAFVGLVGENLSV